MRLPPKSNSVGSKGIDGDSSLHELVAASFGVLEDNINDIIAFEEAADVKQYDFDRQRKMYASPSERYMMPSPKQPKVKTRIKTPSPAQEQRKKRLSLNSDSSWISDSKRNSGVGAPQKRMSLTSDSSWMKSPTDTNEGADQTIKPSSIRRLSVQSDSSHQSSQQSNNDDKGNKPVPSNKLYRKPSERALYELKQLSKKFESDMKIDELRQELELASKTYEIFGAKAPFGIDSAERGADDVSRRSSNTKRISFQKDLPPSFNEKDAVGAVKELLTFFQSSLQEYTQQQQQHLDLSESATEDDHHLTKEIDTAKERRLSDVTLDTTISNEKNKRPSQIVAVDVAKEEDEKAEKMRLAKSTVYANAGRSMQVNSSNDNATPTASGGAKTEQKRKFGESLGKLFKIIKAWIQRQIEAFVASFTPKEKMIVRQMG